MLLAWVTYDLSWRTLLRQRRMKDPNINVGPPRQRKDEEKERPGWATGGETILFIRDLSFQLLNFSLSKRVRRQKARYFLAIVKC